MSLKIIVSEVILRDTDLNLPQSKSPPRVQHVHQRPILMTRRQLTDPFGSDEEEENIQIIDEKWSQSISINKSQTPVRDVSIFEIAQIIPYYVVAYFMFHYINKRFSANCCIS